jgi:hypothetical protein
VESEETKLALVRTANGKVAALSLTPTSTNHIYALSRSIGTLTTSSSNGMSWKGSKATLTIKKTMKGSYARGTESAAVDVTCKKVASTEAASWRTANALEDYASEIDGIASAILEETEEPMPKDYTVFVVETSRRSSLSLGNIAANTAGSMSKSSDPDDSLLDENDFSYGAMSAAYSLGGGDDYGEWFQAVSDGVTLIGNMNTALKSSGLAGFIAREKVTALKPLVGGQSPSALEITVGAWTFFLPDSFPAGQ